MSDAATDIPPQGPGGRRRGHRGLALFVAALLVVIIILIAANAFMRGQTVALPVPTGASVVGRTELALNDAARADPFGTQGRTRDLAVWIWYPAMPGTTGTPAPYLPAPWAMLVKGQGPLSQDLRVVRTNSIANAPAGVRPPVVVLMPGLGQPVASYSALAEDLASHGYAVIGINPIGSVDVVFPDGRVAKATSLGNVSESSVDAWYDSAARVTDVWADDAEFVVETLAARPPAIGALDFQHVAYVGHSLGGAAAFEACNRNPACGAAVDLDGTLWTGVRSTGLDAPSLLIQAAPPGECDEFCERAAADFDTATATANAQRFVVAGTKHMDFSDAGLMWGPINPLVLGSIDAERMTAITRDVVRSFLDVHVRGASAATFTEATSRYAEIEDAD